MATLEIQTIDLLLLANIGLFGTIIYLLKTRSSALFTRQVNLSSATFKAEQLAPNDLIVLSVPDASDTELREIENALQELGVVNAVVVNNEIEQFKQDKVNLEPTEDMRQNQ